MKKQDFLDAIKRAMKKDPNEQDMNFIDALAQGLEDAMGKDAVERKKQIDEITQMIGSFDEGKSAASVIRAMAQQIEDIEKRAMRGLSQGDKDTLRRKLEEKKDEIIRARTDKSNNGVWALEFKASRAASAMMTTSNVLTGAQAINSMNVFDDTEITVIRYPKNFVMDAISSTQVAKVPNPWRWKEQAAESDGNAGVIAEGTTKTLTDSTFSWKYSDRKKYAGRIEFTEELAQDFEQLLVEIIEMIERKVVRSWNKGVQADIIAWAPAYTTTGFDDFYIAPGVAEVISAGKIHCSNNNYDPDQVWLNPIDAAKAMIHQATDGRITYIPEAVAFSGLTPFISNHIPAGTILVGESGIIREQHGSFILRRGLYGNQFIENEETIVGEVFSNLKLTTESKKGWVKLDVPTVLAAITKPVAP